MNFFIFQLLSLQTMLHMEVGVQHISFKGLKINCGPRNVVSRVEREAWGRCVENSLERRKRGSQRQRTCTTAGRSGASRFQAEQVGGFSSESPVTTAIKCSLHWPGGSDGKESTCNAGDMGSIPGLGRSPGERKGYPLQYSSLEKSKDRGAWRATVHMVIKSWTRLNN